MCKVKKCNGLKNVKNENVKNVKCARQKKVQLFFSSCLVDVSVAVIGPSCLSLVMVQGMRLLSRWWRWW